MQLRHKVKVVVFDKNICSAGMSKFQPVAEKRLYVLAQHGKTGKLHNQRRAIGNAADFVMEVQQTRYRPVDGGIPNDLSHHDLGITHQRILVLIGTEPGISEEQEELIVNRRALLNILSIQSIDDQIASKAVGYGHQITTRRI